MKLAQLFVLCLFVIGCSSLAPSHVPMAEAVKQDWTVVHPTAWKPATTSTNTKDTIIEFTESSPVENAHILIMTVQWDGDASDFAPAMVMDVLEHGYAITSGHSAIVSGKQATFIAYEINGATLYQLNVGHKDHGHMVVCAIADGVSELEKQNCLSSINTFSLNDH